MIPTNPTVEIARVSASNPSKIIGMNEAKISVESFFFFIRRAKEENKTIKINESKRGVVKAPSATEISINRLRG